MTLTETGPGPRGVTTGDLLVVEDITVQFGGVVANDNVSLSCRRGSITALIGPNGAGKSTFFDVVTGARRPNKGRVFFDGVDVTDTPPYVRARMGIGRTFQNLAVARSMSVLDNVVLGTLRMRRSGLLAALARTPAARRGDDELRAVAERALRPAWTLPRQRPWPRRSWPSATAGMSPSSSSSTTSASSAPWPTMSTSSSSGSC